MTTPDFARTMPTSSEATAPGISGDIFSRICRSAFLRILGDLEEGTLTIRENGRTITLDHGHSSARPHRSGSSEASLSTIIDASGPEAPLSAVIDVSDPLFYKEALLHGSVGAGRAYFENRWSSPNLVAVIQLFARNENVLRRWREGAARVLAPFQFLFHRLRRNTKHGSRENIGFHYDLSNELFAQILDETMTYSAALFEEEDTTLAEASTAKLDRICRSLELSERDHVLEIGGGWGSFAIHAARNYGCRVTTTTISQEQYELAVDRVRTAGLEDQVTIVQKDYRDLDGTYDKIASIEMIEAVGHDYLEGYFRQCDQRLRPGGRFCLQAITIRDEHYDKARKTLDYIKRYIFPGSDIPSRGIIQKCVDKVTQMESVDTFEMTYGYARTLAEWRKNLLRNSDSILPLGFDDRFVRMWDFYFAYCEGGFRESRIQCWQLTFQK